MERQEKIAEYKRREIFGWNLGWWYGTKCEKCCGFFPELCHRNTNDKNHDTYYRCIACGKQTDYFSMPWVAAEAWNKHEYMGEGVQLSFL